MPIRRRLEGDDVLIGAISSLPDPFAAEVLGWAGFDWVCVDLQHGMAAQGDLVGLLQAFATSDTPVLVRVPWNEPAAIMKALDSGASGVIVPMVNSAEEAARAVAACRYPPAGIRSWGPTRAALGKTRYNIESANQEVLCAVMIETQEAMAELDAILSVPGVDAVFIGPSDLAVAHGMAPSLSVDDPAVDRLITEILRRAQAHGVIPAIFTSGRAPAARFGSAGFRMMTVASDRLLMSDAAKALLALIHEDRAARSG